MSDNLDYEIAGISVAILKWTMVSGNGQLLNINRLLELAEFVFENRAGRQPLPGTISI
jgi:hypothetical protein